MTHEAFKFGVLRHKKQTVKGLLHLPSTPSQPCLGSEAQRKGRHTADDRVLGPFFPLRGCHTQAEASPDTSTGLK